MTLLLKGGTLEDGQQADIRIIGDKVHTIQGSLAPDDGDEGSGSGGDDSAPEDGDDAKTPPTGWLPRTGGDFALLLPVLALILGGVVLLRIRGSKKVGN